MAFEWDEREDFTLGFLSSLLEGDITDIDRVLGLCDETEPALMDSLQLLDERESSSLQNLHSLCEDISSAPPSLKHLPLAMASTQESGESKKSAGKKRKKVRFKEDTKKTAKRRKEGGVEKIASESENESLALPNIPSTETIGNRAATAVAALVEPPPVITVLEEGSSPSNGVAPAPVAAVVVGDSNIMPDGVLETDVDDYVLESMQDTSKLGDGVWVSGTKPVSYITDQQKKCYNYGQSLVYLAVNCLDAMLSRNPLRRNHKHCMDALVSAFEAFDRVLQTFKAHEEELERLRVFVDGSLLPYPPSVTETPHPLQSIPSIRVENSIERLLQSSNLPIITAQDILDDTKKRDEINYYKTRTRFIETLGPVDGDLARIRIGEVLMDLAFLRLIPPADYDKSEVVDALFARLGEKLTIKLQAFVFTRCERKQKLIQRHPSQERKNARERDFVSASLKKSLKEEKSNYASEFKNRVTCLNLIELG